MSETPTFNPESKKAQEVQKPLEKFMLEQILERLQIQCDPNRSTLGICLQLPATAPLLPENIKFAREQLIKQLNPDLIDKKFNNPALTQKAEMICAQINRWVTDFLAQNFQNQPLVDSEPQTTTADTSSQNSSANNEEKTNTTEAEVLKKINRAHNLEELETIIKKMGNFSWNINDPNSSRFSGTAISSLFRRFDFKQTEPDLVALLLFPPILREKITEFFYQTKIEAATDWQQFQNTVKSVPEFKINGQKFKATEILQRFAQPNFQLDYVLDYYGLKTTYNKIHSTQHKHFKEQTYHNFNGTVQNTPPWWWGKD